MNRTNLGKHLLSLRNWTSVMLAIFVVITALVMHRYNSVVTLYEALLRDTFFARTEANIVESEEQLFQSLLRQPISYVMGDSDTRMQDATGVLFMIITDPSNCSNSLETDIQALNRIHKTTENVVVQGYYASPSGARVSEFALMHKIAFPFDMAPSWDHISALDSVTTPLILAYDLASGSVVGVHHPIPDDVLKSTLFYERFRPRFTYQ